jgi:hypothetical protein
MTLEELEKQYVESCKIYNEWWDNYEPTEEEKLLHKKFSEYKHKPLLEYLNGQTNQQSQG